MAKELPYFQFEPAEYLTKDISFCSLAAQGLFINICSYYWQRKCKLTKDQLLRRLNNIKEFDELIDEGVIDLESDGSTIKVKFLDVQYENATKTSKVNSINGSKGGRPKKKKPNKTETKANLNPNQSETKGIREDKIKEDKKNNKGKIDVDAIESDFLNLLEAKNLISDKSHQMWRESFYMKYKLQEGALSKILDNFIIDLNLKNDKDKPKNLKDFKNHFINWSNVQERFEKFTEYKKNKSRLYGAL